MSKYLIISLLENFEKPILKRSEDEDQEDFETFESWNELFKSFQIGDRFRHGCRPFDYDLFCLANRYLFVEYQNEYYIMLGTRRVKSIRPDVLSVSIKAEPSDFEENQREPSEHPDEK